MPTLILFRMAIMVSLVEELNNNSNVSCSLLDYKLLYEFDYFICANNLVG